MTSFCFYSSSWKSAYQKKYIAVYDSCLFLICQRQIKSEIIYCIVVRDICYHFSKSLFIGRIFSIFYPISNHFTQDSSKIFMSGIGKKTSGICKHSNKIPKQTKICQRCHLFCHSCLVIIKPPCWSLLNFSNCALILKASKNRSDRSIIIWI